ncbi:MAG TPA: methyltransferase domain-containing protein [Candidatus Latescibacteria bacterium]|nr:hypothetical protein [Gemmatimonadota bacterium]HCV21950.1 hypothetical protein [Candidatus Latescibacterota bacterium]HJN26677.1 methyltransferase domain-containing protein [Candidatus Latescibacterota bacterium]
MLKRYARRQTTRTLAKYDTVSIDVDIDADLSVSMVQTRDAYVLLDRLIEQEEAGMARVTRFPYWAEIWPASVGLSRWFVGSAPEPETTEIRELGCGLGLVGVSLARAGWRIEATDFVEDALVLASHNARTNGIPEFQHRVAYLDWSHPVGESVDCFVASDVAYEKVLHPYLIRTLRQMLNPGGRFYISDPRRPAAQPLFEALQEMGYEHECQTVDVDWQSLTHQIDVHCLTRPR